jgi:hypothetical protein
LQRLYGTGTIIAETHTAEGTELVVDMPEGDLDEYAQFEHGGS